MNQLSLQEKFYNKQAMEHLQLGHSNVRCLNMRIVGSADKGVEIIIDEFYIFIDKFNLINIKSQKFTSICYIFSYEHISSFLLLPNRWNNSSVVYGRRVGFKKNYLR